MRSKGCARACLFGGIFLLLFCIIAGSSLAAQNAAANGAVGTGKAVLTLKKTAYDTGASIFDAKGLERFSDDLKIQDMTYFAPCGIRKSIR